MTTSKQSSLHFSNSFGLIFDDRIYLQRANALSYFYIENLKSVKLTKTQEKKVNVFSFIFSIVVVCFACFYTQNNLTLMITSFTIGAALLLLTFWYKKYLYTIIILTNTNDFISIEVNNDLKNSAKEFIINLNKKLKENDRFLRVG